MVNDTPISTQQWQQAIAAVNQDRRTALDRAGELRILQTLIDEELLLQLAQDMGLTHSIPEVRGRLVQATMAALSQGLHTDPSDAQLQTFIEEQAHLFQEPEKRRVRAWRQVKNQEAQALPIPDELMSQRQLQRWLGQSLAQAAFAAPTTGPLDKPMRLGEAEYHLVVEAVQAPQPLKLEAIDRERALRLYQREQEEAQLAQALERLASEARIVRRPAP